MSRSSLARIAGALYLAMSVLFIVAGMVRGRIVVPTDATATADNIRASATLFRLGLLSDVVSGALFLATAVALYFLLRHVDRPAALAMLLFVALAVAIGSIAQVAQLSALTVAGGIENAKTLGQGQVDGLVLVLTQVQTNALAIDELFWGLWLFPFGYLLWRSGLFPKWLGLLIIVGGVSWLGQFLVQILVPDLARAASILTIGGIGEPVTIAWLLIKGASAETVESPRLNAAVPTRT